MWNWKKTGINEVSLSGAWLTFKGNQSSLLMFLCFESNVIDMPSIVKSSSTSYFTVGDLTFSLNKDLYAGRTLSVEVDLVSNFIHTILSSGIYTVKWRQETLIPIAQIIDVPKNGNQLKCPESSNAQIAIISGRALGPGSRRACEVIIM